MAELLKSQCDNRDDVELTLDVARFMLDVGVHWGVDDAVRQSLDLIRAVFSQSSSCSVLTKPYYHASLKKHGDIPHMHVCHTDDLP